LNTSGEIDNCLKQYLAISEFPDLEYFHSYQLSCFKEFAMMVEKTKGNIITFKVIHSIPINSKSINDAGMLIKAIANNCPRIKELTIYLKPKDFIHVKLLLLNCKHLKDINFVNAEDENVNIGDELLDILTKFSPNSLTKISISEDWKYSIDALEQFFESYRERTLHYFGTSCNNDNNNYITEDHKMIVRKYIDEGMIVEAYL
jgi:hypothetical protein